MTRRALFGMLLGGAGYALYRVATPGKRSSAENPNMIPFDELPDGAELIEQAVAIERAGQEPLCATIVRVGTELRIMIAQTLYRITNPGLYPNTKATELVTSIKYRRDGERILIRSDKRAIATGTCDASIPRETYEELARKLDLEKPASLTAEVRSDVDARPFFKGEHVFGLQLEQETDHRVDGTQLASL